MVLCMGSWWKILAETRIGLRALAQILYQGTSKGN